MPNDDDDDISIQDAMGSDRAKQPPTLRDDLAAEKRQRLIDQTAAERRHPFDGMDDDPPPQQQDVNDLPPAQTDPGTEIA